MQVQLPDGTVKDYPARSSALDVARSISERLAQATIAVQIARPSAMRFAPLEDLSTESPIPVKLITNKDAAALGVLRHSCAHIMARAVMRLYEGVGSPSVPRPATDFTTTST